MDPGLPTSGGYISPFAGNYVHMAIDTGDNGPATVATVSSPYAIAVDTMRGVVYVAGEFDHIR